MARRTLLVLLLAANALPGRTAAQIPLSEYQSRRSRLAAEMESGVLLALGAREPARDYIRFDQSAPFLYLTGFQEPEAALVMVKRGGNVSSLLFVQPRDPASEVWSGVRAGVDGARSATGLDARPRGELRPMLDSLLRSGLPLYVVGEHSVENDPADGGDLPLTEDEQFVRSMLQRHPGVRVIDANPIVQRLRGTKSPAELALLRRAIAITVLAHREAARAIEPGMNEFEIEALIEYTFRRNGADRPAFATIVGSGPNSTTLHYHRNDRFMRAGDVVVMDIGASYRGYAADVTRTVPVSGTFTPDQRAIYQLVRDAQAAAERQVRIGARASLMSDSASAVLTAGLARLGLIESRGATYDCAAAPVRQCPQLQLYYMHGLGHGIGLDVHDPEQYYFTGVIQPGSVFTIEPGIYVRENLLAEIPDTPRNRALAARIGPAVMRFRNIGVRIEDDYIVTERGVEWVSRAAREIHEIEALMRESWRGPAPRDPAVVDWYRETDPAKRP